MLILHTPPGHSEEYSPMLSESLSLVLVHAHMPSFQSQSLRAKSSPDSGLTLKSHWPPRHTPTTTDKFKGSVFESVLIIVKPNIRHEPHQTEQASVMHPPRITSAAVPRRWLLDARPCAFFLLNCSWIWFSWFLVISGGSGLIVNAFEVFYILFFLLHELESLLRNKRGNFSDRLNISWINWWKLSNNLSFQETKSIGSTE